MAGLSEKRRRILKECGIIAFLLLALILSGMSILGDRGYLALRKKQREYEKLQAEILQLRQKKEQLLKEIDALRQDPKAIEEVAREELHLALPEDLVVKIPERDPKDKKERP
ncbi:MAG: septum formation initiator family protein [Acidobacteria bacterium]|nr:septum formation initiator family protein [Acidobacteriota bacterium]